MMKSKIINFNGINPEVIFIAFNNMNRRLCSECGFKLRDYNDYYKRNIGECISNICPSLYRNCIKILPIEKQYNEYKKRMIGKGSSSKVLSFSDWKLKRDENARLDSIKNIELKPILGVFKPLEKEFYDKLNDVEKVDYKKKFRKYSAELRKKNEKNYGVEKKG